MQFIRQAIRQLAGYVPGEQPQEPGWIKLNTNENPYPPSPSVADAVNEALQRGLQVYPDPLATPFREAAAAVFDVEPEWILPANGSDENLTIILRTFVEPGDAVGYPYPGYVLYETLGRMQDADVRPLLLREDWSFDATTRQEAVDGSKVLLVPNPNSPSGTFWSNSEIAALVPKQGILVLDGAYADFADEPPGCEMLRGDAGRQIVMTRTLSKSYSLAGLRFGFAIAHPDMISEMRKVKDSYNCDTLAIAAATAAIRDQAWMQDNRDRIVATRTRLAGALTDLGFAVTPSQANFLWVRHASGEHRRIYEELKRQRILIRYMPFPLVADGAFDGLRITAGRDDEIDQLLEALTSLL